MLEINSLQFFTNHQPLVQVQGTKDQFLLSIQSKLSLLIKKKKHKKSLNFTKEALHIT